MQDAIIPLMRCPLCHSAFARRENSLVCGRGHCFDIARQGYVNFVPHEHGHFYTKALFESRAAVFQSGLFEPAVCALSRALERYVLPHADHPVIVDAGCGEGYYVKRVCPGVPMTRIGFDLCKEAVRLASRGKGEGTFFAADLSCIPLTDGCADAILNVFTPANYREFRRVLKPGGVLLKLAPREGYLKELRQAAAGFLRHEAYDGARVERYAQSHMEMIEQTTITAVRDVSPDLAEQAARMTPMLAGIDPRALDLSRVTRLTLDETLFVGTVKDTR